MSWLVLQQKSSLRAAGNRMCKLQTGKMSNACRARNTAEDRYQLLRAFPCPKNKLVQHLIYQEESQGMLRSESVQWDSQGLRHTMHHCTFKFRSLRCCASNITLFRRD